MSKFEKIARKIAKRGGQDEKAARRYLDICGREKILRVHVCRLMDGVHKNNPLFKIKMKVPLSVAGSPSSIMVRAEHLVLKGCQIAMAFDSEGRHRGMAIEDVAFALKTAGLGVHKPETILSMYASLTAPMADVLTYPNMPIKARKITDCLNRIAILRASLEREIARIMVPEEKGANPTARFSVIVGRAKLMEALPNTPSCVLGYDGTSVFDSEGKPRPNEALRVDGCTGVECCWAIGRGVAVFSTESLRKVLSVCQHAVTIECHFGYWSAWPDSTPGMIDKQKPITFAYYRQSEDDEDQERITV